MEVEGIRGRIAAAELERLERQLAEVEERKTEALQDRRLRDERLNGVLEERRRAEDELSEAATRHESATAALYRLRSAIERVQLRRENAEETGRRLRDEAARPRLPIAPDSPGYERALAAASGWSASRAAELSEAVDRLEGAQADGLDAVVALAAGEVWFASGHVKRAEPRLPAPTTSLSWPRKQETAGHALALAAESAALRGAAACARRCRRHSLRAARRDAPRARSAGGRATASGGSRVGTAHGRRDRGGRARARETRPRRAHTGRGETETLTDEEVDELRAQVERLERRREALGQVNPLAAEEHARESERLKDLVAQRQDAERSLVELEKLRDDLTNTVERMFEETYAAVEKHFAEVASTLFPGGKGRLIRTDDEEPGIEIEAPAGRKEDHTAVALVGR